MAELNYGMFEDVNNGICINKPLDFYTYEKLETGCTHINITGHTVNNTPIGLYVIPYENLNLYYTGDTNQLSLNEPIETWIISYINSLSTGGTIEERVLKSNNGLYYKIEHDYEHCKIDSSPRWAIINTYAEPERPLMTGDLVPYYYDEIDTCGNRTGKRFVKIQDINQYSATYGDSEIIERVSTETVPIVTTNMPTVLTSTSAIFSGEISSDGGFPIIRAGICYSRFPNPTINDSIMELDWILGPTAATLNNLSEEKYYYTRMFAENALGIGYGNSQIFKTLGLGSFNLQTSDDYNLTNRTMSVNGVISNPSEIKILNTGICWTTGSTPTINDNVVIGQFTGNTFQYYASGLTYNKLYSFKPYVITKNFGAIYGNSVSHTIGGVPKFGNDLHIYNENIGRNYIEVKATLVDWGWPNQTDNTIIHEAGFCYNTSPNPTTGNTKVVINNYNTFQQIINNLNTNTTYYLKAYAINSSGVSYSNEISGLTKSYSIPEIFGIWLTPVSSSEITITSLISDTGGTPITSYGIQWGNSMGSFTGSTQLGTSIEANVGFGTTLTNLIPNTKYFIRIYAINSQGTAYTGNNISTSTLDSIRLTIRTDIDIEFTWASADSMSHIIFTNNNTVDIENIDYNKPFGLVFTGIYNIIDRSQLIGGFNFSTFEVTYTETQTFVLLNTGSSEYPERYEIFVASGI